MGVFEPKPYKDSNSGDEVLSAAAQRKIVGYVQGMERIEDDIAALRADQKEMMATAKGEGFEPVYIRKTVALRKKDKDKRREQRKRLDLYLHATGDLDDDI